LKSREQKESIIADLKERFRESPGAVLMGYQGLKVAQIRQMRRDLMPQGAKFTVIKNTLARIASKGTAFEKMMANLEGPRAVTFLGKDPSPILKLLLKMAKDMAALTLIEGMIEGGALDAAGIKTFSELPSRDEMRSMILGMFQAPMGKFLSVLAGPPRDMVGVLNAQADKLEKGGAAA